MVRRGYTGRGGPNNRPLRYPISRTVKISSDADDTLDDMAQAQSTTKMNVMRRAIMKDIYIYKSKQQRRESAEQEPSDNAG
jgi:predicted transcriptional regulator